jgi:hypothetical protein
MYIYIDQWDDPPWFLNVLLIFFIKLYIYIYIYVCVCVCVCVFLALKIRFDPLLKINLISHSYFSPSKQKIIFLILIHL